MPSKTVAKKQSKISKSNDKFAQMSKAEKRVEIAKDVLLRLKAKKLKAEPGSWVKGTLKNAIKNAKPEQQLNKVMPEVCRVCALGACFVGAVGKFNHLTIGEANEKHITYNLGQEVFDYDSKVDCISTNLDVALPQLYLKRFFSQNQMALIENAFENGEGANMYCSLKEDKMYNASQYFPEKCKPNDRIRLLMENIILNKGEFKLNLLPVKRKGKWVLEKQ